MRGQVQLEPAWLLHPRPFRDSSLLLEVFSRDHGRVGLVARGARRARARERALLQAFTPLRLSWRGTGELATLTGAEPDGPAVALAGTRLLAGYYLNELLLRLLARGDEHAALFDGYGRTLRDLANAAHLAVPLRHFECGLLEALGYGLNLEHDIVDGQSLDPAARYEYLLEQGPRRLAGEAPAGALCLSGDTLIDILERRFEAPETRAAARRLFTAALDLYLGGRPLKSRQVLEATLRLGRGTAASAQHGKEC